jgi:hypothetical protein
MDTLDDIRRAIGRLTPAQRHNLEVWIREVAYMEDGVREPRPEYAAPPPHYLSVEEYLRFEELSLTRHEYVGGELFAMTGATKQDLERVFLTDPKLRVIPTAAHPGTRFIGMLSEFTNVFVVYSLDE